MKTVTKECRVKLTSAEIEDRRAQLVEQHGEWEQLEAKKREAVSSWNAKLKEIRKRMAETGAAAREGAELREVECDEVMDYAAKEVRTVRKDTSEVVERRRMTADELQESIPGSGPKGAPAAAAAEAKTGGKRKLHAVPTEPPPDAH